jgi:hypothetical protein
MQIRYRFSFYLIPAGLESVKRLDAMECVVSRLGANESKVPVARGSLRHRNPSRGVITRRSRNQRLVLVLE